MATQNPFIWHELVTPDHLGSKKFFRELFGWNTREVDSGKFGIYTIFEKAGKDVAGMMNPMPLTPGNGSYCHSYISVEDIDHCAKKAADLGGQVLIPPHDVPEVGSICMLSDPAGAIAYLKQPISN